MQMEKSLESPMFCVVHDQNETFVSTMQWSFLRAVEVTFDGSVTLLAFVTQSCLAKNVSEKGHFPKKMDETLLSILMSNMLAS